LIRYRYNEQLDPPAPFVHVSLERPDGGATLENLPAQVDTAADLSVVPGGLVEQLKLVQFDALPVAAFGGIVKTVPTYLGRLSVRGHAATVVEVVSSAEEPHILLGRDVLNRHRILLDGPRAVMEIE
jgi:hypothetical protein